MLTGRTSQHPNNKGKTKTALTDWQCVSGSRELQGKEGYFTPDALGVKYDLPQSHKGTECALVGRGESFIWGQAGGRNCWKAAPTGDVAKNSINPSLGSQPPLSCQARGWGRAHLWVPSSQAQASVMNSSNVRKKSRFPWVGPPSRAVYLHKNDIFP